MSALDIIELPGQPGKYGRRLLVEAWQEAGSPPVNDAGRLKAQQMERWTAYRNGTGSPADNPDRPDLYPLAHVRFVALDIDATPERVRRLSAAGLVRPYSYEPWHWQLPGDVRQYALVTEIPSTAHADWKAFPEITEENMKDWIIVSFAEANTHRNGIHMAAPGHWRTLSAEDWDVMRNLTTSDGKPLLDGVKIVTPFNARAFDVLRSIYVNPVG